MIQKMTIVNAIQVEGINQLVCKKDKIEHRCYDIGKIESVLHQFFPSSKNSFSQEEIPSIAACLSFHISKAHAFFAGNKRTAFLTAALYLKLNGIVLVYPPNSFADLMKKCDSGYKGLDDVKKWFETYHIFLDPRVTVRSK